MYAERPTDSKTISTPAYRLVVDRQLFHIEDPATNHNLISAGQPVLLYPDIHGRDVTWARDRIAFTPSDSWPAVLNLSARSDAGRVETEIKCFVDHIELSTRFHAAASLTIGAWNVFAPHTRLGLFHLHHWRNRHGHTSTYETYNLLQGGKSRDGLGPEIPAEMVTQWTQSVDVTTFSTDFQFAPRPSMFVFQRDEILLGIGWRDLPHGFGLEFKAAAHCVQHLRLSCGREHGQQVDAGQTVQSGRMYLWFDRHKTVWDSVDHYVNLLQEDEMIPSRGRPREVPQWWLRPMYCTWNDQGYLSGNGAYYNWPGDNFKQTKSPIEAFDGKMLDYLLDILEREEYSFGSVIIDDGWQAARGHWQADPTRFPNLRSQIDRIHAMGMRALLWIAPFDYEPQTPILRQTQWLAGHGVLGKWKMPLVDFSHPRVREEYAEPLLRYFFSDAPGCLNADGLKTDFMADKIHPIFPMHDPEWRGEERFIRNTLQLFYDRLKHYKPDGMMLGCSAHPFSTTCQDLIRTYDVPDSQEQHVDRCVMLNHFNPGNFVSLDMSESRSLADVERHWDMAIRHNMLYECGRIAPDPANGRMSLGDDYVSLLKRKLRVWA